jgi:hypothetical protein
MLQSMTTTQQFTLTVKPVDAKGHDAPVENATWASSNEAVATAVPDPSGLTAMIVAQGVGDYTISFAGDADMGPGTTTITAQDSGSVTQGQAVAISFVQGPLTDQP